MSKNRYHQLLAQIGDSTKKVNLLFDAADKRGDGVNTQAEIDEIKALNKQIEEWDKEAAELAELEQIRQTNTKRADSFNTPVIGGIPLPNGGDGGQQSRSSSAIKTIGELVLENPEFKAWWQANAQLLASGNRKFDAPSVPFKTLLTGAGNTSAGPLVFPDFKPIIDQSYQRPLNIRDIITIGETMSDQVEYVRVTGVTNNAAPTAEATATSNGSGQKPESEMTMERIAETVKTIAHWIPATSRALADAGQLRTLIDSFLRYGLEEKLEDQLINGNGSGENFTGILNLSGTTAQAWDTDILTTTRKARTKVRVQGRTVATAWVMHPNDWETIDLLQNNEGNYFYGGPMRMGQPTLWGLPVIESEAMSQGYTVCANWRLCVLWDRMMTAISMSNSHSDFFTRNLIAILAEMRAALGWIRPKAFVVTDLTA